MGKMYTARLVSVLFSVAVWAQEQEHHFGNTEHQGGAPGHVNRPTSSSKAKSIPSSISSSIPSSIPSSKPDSNPGSFPGNKASSSNSTGSSASSASAGGGKSSPYGPTGDSEVDNVRFANITLACLAAIIFVFAAHQFITGAQRYLRQLTTVNNERQKYFREQSTWYGWLKQHLFYSPLFRTRHHREMRLFSGWGVGILPTRFQSLLLFGIVFMNVFLCCWGIEWDKANEAKEQANVVFAKHLRNRTGTLSVINMIPLVIMAGRNNPLIPLLGVSFDTWNLLHRWFGRIVVAQAVAHTAAWVDQEYLLKGWKGVSMAFAKSDTIQTGTVGTVAFIVIILQASSVSRHAFYETFLHLHILLVVGSLVAMWYHLAEAPTQQNYIKLIIALWVIERFMRVFIMMYRSIGKTKTKAVVESLPGDALRVTLHMSRPWRFRPGQYIYMTVPSIGLWTSHPFSLAWSEEVDGLDSEKGIAMNQQDVLSQQKTTMSMIIRRRDGFTHSLYKKTEASPEGRIVLSTLVEGPYGGLHSLHSYGTVMLFAGGVGISHQVPYVRDLVVGFANGTVSARKVMLIWVIQSPEHLEWIRPWMTQILGLDRRREILRIQLFVTRPRSTKEIHSPSSTVQMFPGRPNVETLIGMESENQVGAMAVSVCGTGGLADDVRRAVRKRQAYRSIDLIEESFSW